MRCRPREAGTFSRRVDGEDTDVTRVRIVTAAHEVEVEATDADPDELASLALWLHEQTRDPKLNRAFGVTHADTPLQY
ncbi:hypothetical protein GCM10020369_28980 [Cryptosporangium minutisporangium]|uniref:Uncharacterized protein n=1 Tax=Cryptosporangium minutisporangium TaxID=113569 RepID=A0ABP6SWL7_9ACTN